MFRRMASIIPMAAARPDAVSFSLPKEVVTSKLAVYASIAMILGFNNRVPDQLA